MQLSLRNVQKQRHKGHQGCHSAIFFPLSLLHFFIFFSLFPFSLQPSLCSYISQGHSHQQLQSLSSNTQREIDYLFFFSFSSKICKKERVGLLGQNSTNIHQWILYDQKMIFTETVWTKQNREGGEKRRQQCLYAQCPHASFSLSLHLCLLKLLVFQSLASMSPFPQNMSVSAIRPRILKSRNQISFSFLYPLPPSCPQEFVGAP